MMGSLVSCETQPKGKTQRCTITACLCRNKYAQDDEVYEPVQDESTPHSETSDTSSDHTSIEVNADGLDTPLSDISHQLEDFLVKKLDVPLEGGRLYGWQHLGRACGISKDDLKYLELAYKRDGGSPTKELLEMLGCKGKKLSDVEDVLQGLGIKIPFLSYEDM